MKAGGRGVTLEGEEGSAVFSVLNVQARTGTDGRNKRSKNRREISSRDDLKHCMLVRTHCGLCVQSQISGCGTWDMMSGGYKLIFLHLYSRSKDKSMKISFKKDDRSRKGTRVSFFIDLH